MKVKTTMKNYLILGTALCGLFIWPKFMFGVICGAVLTTFINGFSITTIKFNDKNEGSQT